MSDDLAKTIERLEQWVSCWTPYYNAKIIADVRTLIGLANMSDATQRALSLASSMSDRREDRIQRALQVLQRAQRYNCGTKAFRPEIMVPYADGSWLRFDDVVKAIQILQEGQT